MNIGKYVQMYSEDLLLKNYSENTIKNYSSQVRKLLIRFQNIATKPSEISEPNIKMWLLEAKTINSRKHRLSAVKLFYKLTGKQPLKLKHIEYPRSERKLPQVIEKNFLLEKISKIQNLKHKSIISLAFSTGVRVSEVINLKIEDIDEHRMIIHIKNAKGAKDRIVPLSEKILILLTEYIQKYQPKLYLFNGQKSLKYSTTSCNKIVKKYIGEKHHFHQLRHSSFTAILDSGTDLRYIQALAGHSSPKTTAIYTHVSKTALNQIKLPI